MKIIIVESEALLRHLLAKICENEFHFEVLAAVGDGESALELCRVRRPDILLLDMMLPDEDGIFILQKILEMDECIKILLLSSRCDPYTVHRALECGVGGFISKMDEPLEILEKAIRAVAAGEKFFSKTILEIRKMLKEDAMAFPKILSGREQQMLEFFAKGLPNQEISERLGLSPKTVQGHRHNIMKKLEIHDTPALMRYAIEQGFWRPHAGKRSTWPTSRLSPLSINGISDEEYASHGG